MKFLILPIYVFCELVESYWCVCDPSASVPNGTSFGTYSHLNYRDVDISRCRHAAFLYSAAIGFDTKLHNFSFSNNRYLTNFSVSLYKVAQKSLGIHR